MTQQARATGKRILLADDDAAARQSLSLLLKIDRHTVVEAANGTEALDLFTKEPFDLVIVDYAMPVMQGNELAAKIKRLAPTQPILMVTAYFEKLVDTTIQVDATLSKPFAVEELRQVVARLAG